MMSLSSLRIYDVRLFFFVLNAVNTLDAVNVFHSCRDNPIQYASTFRFNCSNPNEVIYVDSAIIGFTPLYKADKNVLECPISSDMCTNTTTGPSTFCNGFNECSLAQRMLLYDESGLQCSINGGGNRGGNFINVNYSCIASDSCVPQPGYSSRYACSPKTTVSSSDHSTYPNSQSVPFGSVTTSQSQDDPGRQSSLATIIANGHTLSAGVIVGIIVGAVILIIIVTTLIILLLRRKKRLRFDREPAVILQQTFNQETAIVCNSKDINSNLTTAYEQVSPVVTSHAKKEAKTQEMRDKHALTSESKNKLDNPNSRQQSVYGLAGNVIHYDTVRKSSTPVNAMGSESEIVTNASKSHNHDTDAFSIAEKNDCQAPSQNALQNEPLAHQRKTADTAAEPEYAELRGGVTNHLSRPPQRTDSQRNYYNFTAAETKDEVLCETIEGRPTLGNENHDDGEYVYYAPESDCEYGEVILVDNALYAEDISV